MRLSFGIDDPGAESGDQPLRGVAGDAVADESGDPQPLDSPVGFAPAQPAEPVVRLGGLEPGAATHAAAGHVSAPF
jgi:hypothetical protein